MIHVFIGYDPKEAVAYHTLCHSILRQSSIPVCIVPVNLANLAKYYWRSRDDKQSNDFSFSRFLVPQIAHDMGLKKAIFMDCDLLFRCDIKELVDQFDHHAVSVCQHDYQPKDKIKYLGNPQYTYPRKNWSSLMLFNLSQYQLCDAAGAKVLTTEYVNTAPGLDLHRFNWIDDQHIGSLPLEYNWLVGEYDHNPNAKIVHFTIGGPYFTEYKDCDYADEWREEFNRMIHADQLQDPSFKVIHGKHTKARLEISV